jgi:hypothetical protein
MSMILPVILYGSNKEVIKTSSVVKSNCTYVYSYMPVTIDIISGDATLYSVVINNNQPLITSGQSMTGNNGYTVYIPVDNTSITMRVSNGSSIVSYSMTLVLDNIMSESRGNEHYKDMLINAGLPSYDTIESCIPVDFDKSDLIKRLLLDYKRMLKVKGTIRSIEYFFEFIGFKDDRMSILEEFMKSDGTITLKPDKARDVKNGYYHVWYENFDDGGLDENNMPVCLTSINDLDDFKRVLINAISVANEYFTCEEQLIRLFGLEYGSNIAKFRGITMSMSKVHENDVALLRRYTSINVSAFNKSDEEVILVKNCLQQLPGVYLSEIKVTFDDDTPVLNDPSMYDVVSEVFDDVNYTGDMTLLRRDFGSCLHVSITVKEAYVMMVLTNIGTGIKYTVDKVYVSSDISRLVVINRTGNYNLTVYTWDKFNAMDKYFYDFTVSNDVARIDFMAFSSFIVSENTTTTQDMDSPGKLSTMPDNSYKEYVLPLTSVPDDLKQYFSSDPSTMYRYLTRNDRYMLVDFNKYTPTIDITSSIPTCLVNPYIDIIAFPVQMGKELVMEVFDVNTCEFSNVPYMEYGDHEQPNDFIFITIMEIDNGDNTVTDYYMIMPTETGVTLDKNLYNIMLLDVNTGDTESIYEMEGLSRSKTPVNFDFPLTGNPLATYVSPGPYTVDVTGEDGIKTYTCVRSVMSHLSDVESNGGINMAYLMIGDVFACTIDDRYVVKETDIRWVVQDSFTREILHDTTDYALKYRVNRKTCFDVTCMFKVNGKEYNITKQSIFSSFKFNT